MENTDLWADIENAMNLMCEKIAIIPKVHNRKTASFVNDFVSRRKNILLIWSPWVWSICHWISPGTPATPPRESLHAGYRFTN